MRIHPMAHMNPHAHAGDQSERFNSSSGEMHSFMLASVP